ncbi:hypothetical protein Tco_1240794 [Tanacetum coccineum]
MGGGDMRLLPRGAWDGDGGSGGRGVVLVGDINEWGSGGCGSRRGEWRVVASDMGDRVDRAMSIVFGFGRKSPPENFSDGGGVVAGGGLAREDDRK